MADLSYDKMQNSLISIASELFRFKGVFEKAVSKLDMEDQSKYMSQYAWFSKRVNKALEEANLKILNVEGQMYDPGMAVTPLNIDDFEVEDNNQMKIIIIDKLLPSSACAMTASLGVITAEREQFADSIYVSRLTDKERLH